MDVALGRYSSWMLPDGMVIPELREPYTTALDECLRHVFTQYDVIGILATGTIVRGGGDPRSDLDFHVLIGSNFRERVQLFFNSVPCEIFVNPPSRIPAYFEEDRLDRRPIAPHMFATGVVVYDPTGVVKELVADAKAILADVPGLLSTDEVIAMKYSAATEFEDVEDLTYRNPESAAVLLGSCVRRLIECRIAIELGWKPRAKDLMSVLNEIDPYLAYLAIQASTEPIFDLSIAAASELCKRITGATGFFEWTSPRQHDL